MGDENKTGLERKLAEVVRSAFDLGGMEYLREMEDLFHAETDKIRASQTRSTPGGTGKRSKAHWDRYGEIIGRSPSMLNLFSLMDKVAPSSVPVLIHGASGTGKELIARAIHKNSLRRDEEFLAENCAAIPETLLESELFGYKKGSFTGAEQDKKGLFVVADKGTLFLDEIGEMSLNMQKKLLRALQDGEIRPVGGNNVIHVDVRLISASNKDLKGLIAKGLFREDLYYRLNTVTLEVPLLRERRDDIPDLARYFVDRVAGEMGRAPLPLSDDAIAALIRYRWPGNIRELENEMRRCLAMIVEEREIAPEDLSEEIRGGV